MGSTLTCDCGNDQQCPEINICQRQPSANKIPPNPQDMDSYKGTNRRSTLTEKRNISDNIHDPSNSQPTSDNEQSQSQEVNEGLLGLIGNQDTLNTITTLEQLIPIPTEDTYNSSLGDNAELIHQTNTTYQQPQNEPNEYKPPKSPKSPSLSREQSPLSREDVVITQSPDSMQMEKQQNWITTTIQDTKKRLSETQMKAALVDKYDLNIDRTISDDSSYSDDERKEIIQRRSTEINKDDGPFLSPPISPTQTKKKGKDKKERNLVRIMSGPWDEEDMNDLEDEIKTQMETMKTSEVKVEKSNLFRAQSTHKWTEDNMKAERKEMGKQIMHLLQNSTEADIEQLAKESQKSED